MAWIKGTASVFLDDTDVVLNFGHVFVGTGRVEDDTWKRSWIFLNSLSMIRE